jgi:hypothetical protein
LTAEALIEATLIRSPAKCLLCLSAHDRSIVAWLFESEAAPSHRGRTGAKSLIGPHRLLVQSGELSLRALLKEAFP